MTVRLHLALLVFLCASLLSTSAGTAADIGPDQREAIEAVVHDYLLSHPEVLTEALQAARVKAQREFQAKAESEIAARAREIFSDPHAPTGGNPQGNVTVVEFFDNRCPFCKREQPDIQWLLTHNHELRIVYKEFPILGPVSVVASRAALAARGQGKYQAFHDAMLALPAGENEITDDTVYKVAASVNLDVARLKRDMASPQIDEMIKTNLDLARALDIHGTPTFIIGDHIITGAVPRSTLELAITDARKSPSPIAEAGAQGNKFQ